MKAKEYALSFLLKDLSSEDEINQAVWTTAVEFMNEVTEICKTRHSTSKESVLSAMKEQCQKWEAFSRIVNESVELDLIRPDGLKKLMMVKFPEFYDERRK